MNEPRNVYETLILTANQRQAYNCNAHSFLLLSNTVATAVKVGIDTDVPQSWPAWRRYAEPNPVGRFSRIVFENPTGSPMTITFVVSQGLVSVATEYGSLTTVISHLANIATDAAALEILAEIPDTPTAIAEAVIPQTGVGQNQLITAAATTRRILVQADYANTGAVYVGFATGVTAANAPIHLQPGDSWPEDFAGNVWASSANGTEKARAYVIKIS